MESSEGPVLVEGTAAFECRNGIMFISRNGRCKEAMLVSAFHEYIYDGMRALRAWHTKIDAAETPAQIRPSVAERGRH